MKPYHECACLVKKVFNLHILKDKKIRMFNILDVAIIFDFFFEGIIF